MQTEKIDRRVQRTKQLLREALVALILQKGFAAITVQDILDQANLGRSTFYSHYRDKDDLLLSGFEELLTDFQHKYMHHPTHASGPDFAGKEFSLFMFEHAGANRPLFNAMFGKQGGELIQRAAQKYLTQTVEKYLAAHFQALHSPYPTGLLIEYVVSSYLAILTWWLDQNAPYTPQEMNTFFWNLVSPGIQSALNPQHT